jgi:indole-3-glycerol phosphate synthase
MLLHPMLQGIVDHKKEEVAHLRRMMPSGALRDAAAAVSGRRPFANALRKSNGKVNIIAEIKRSSPSKMLMPTRFDPVGIAKAYEQNGAAAISVLTDTRFFCGAASFLPAVRQAVSIPVLRKEFIVDPWQLEETAALGADAVLLMAVLFDDPAPIAELYHKAIELDLQPLVEVHTEREWEQVAALDPQVVGINNRDFTSDFLPVDILATKFLAPKIDHKRVIVSESGIDHADNIATLAHFVDAYLIGSAFMKTNDPGNALKGMLDAANAQRREVWSVKAPDRI